MKEATIATHYDAIGIHAETLDELEGIVNDMVPTSRWVPVHDDTGFGVWEDDGGAALWIQIEEGTVAGAHPFYHPAGVHALRVEGAEADPPMDGVLRAFLLPGAETLLPMDVVNWPLAEGMIVPQAGVEARVAGFAESLSVWSSEDAYIRARGDARPIGARWIAPTGLFPAEKGGTGRATARIAGIVRAAAHRTNALTGGRFRVLAVETEGAVLDVVAPDGPLPSPGAVAEGHLWLAALVLTPEAAP